MGAAVRLGFREDAFHAGIHGVAGDGPLYCDTHVGIAGFDTLEWEAVEMERAGARGPRERCDARDAPRGRADLARKRDIRGQTAGSAQGAVTNASAR